MRVVKITFLANSLAFVTLATVTIVMLADRIAAHNSDRRILSGLHLSNATFPFAANEFDLTHLQKISEGKLLTPDEYATYIEHLIDMHKALVRKFPVIDERDVHEGH